MAFTWLTWSAHGNAEGRRLLVVLGPEEPTYWPWLRAELGSSGFAVKPSQAATFPPTPTAIEELALREGVAIGVAPLEAGSGIEIWLVDPISHRLAYREVLLGLYQPGEAPDVVAVRMAETLRATLIELGQRRGTVELPKPAPRLAAPQPPPARFMLGVGAGAAFSPGGVGSIGYVDVALGWRIAPRFSLLVDGALTPFATRLRGAEGTARVDWHWAGAALSFCVTDPAASLRLRSGAGVWLTVLTLTGQAAPPFENRRVTSVSAIPHVDLGLRWSLTERLGLGADLSAGFAAPGVAIEFADRRNATWGRPLWLGRLLLETSLD